MSEIRKMSWSRLGAGLRGFGWELENKPNVKKFKRGLQQISVVRVSRKNWKVEYFYRGRLVDSGGISSEEYAKILAAEFSIIK